MGLWMALVINDKGEMYKCLRKINLLKRIVHRLKWKEEFTKLREGKVGVEIRKHYLGEGEGESNGRNQPI